MRTDRAEWRSVTFGGGRAPGEAPGASGRPRMARSTGHTSPDGPCRVDSAAPGRGQLHTPLRCVDRAADSAVNCTHVAARTLPCRFSRSGARSTAHASPVCGMGREFRGQLHTSLRCVDQAANSGQLARRRIARDREGQAPRALRRSDGIGCGPGSRVILPSLRAHRIVRRSCLPARQDLLAVPVTSSRTGSIRRSRYLFANRIHSPFPLLLREQDLLAVPVTSSRTGSIRRSRELPRTGSVRRSIVLLFDPSFPRSPVPESGRARPGVERAG
jgi:hypothetical protein